LHSYKVQQQFVTSHPSLDITKNGSKKYLQSKSWCGPI